MDQISKSPETALQSIRNQTGELQARIVEVTAQLRTAANAAFGDPGEGKTGSDSVRDQRSGAVGSIADALDYCSELMTELENQAGRFQYLA